MTTTPDDPTRIDLAAAIAASSQERVAAVDESALAPAPEVPIDRGPMLAAINPASLADLRFDRRALIDKLDGPELAGADSMAEAVAHYFELVGHVDRTASAGKLCGAFLVALHEGPVWGFDPQQFDVTEKMKTFLDPEKRNISAGVSAVSIGGTSTHVVTSNDISLARPVSIDNAKTINHRDSTGAKTFETPFDLFDHLMPEEALTIVKDAYDAAASGGKPFCLSLTLPFPVDRNMEAVHLSGKWRCDALAPFNAKESRKDDVEYQAVPELFCEYLQERLGITVDPGLLAISYNDTEADIWSEAPNLAQYLAQNSELILGSFIIGTGCNMGVVLQLKDGRFMYINLEAGHNTVIRPSLLDTAVCDKEKNPADFEILVATKYMDEIFKLALKEMVGDHPIVNQMEELGPKQIAEMMFYLVYGAPANDNGGNLERTLSSLRAKDGIPDYLRTRTLNEMHLLRETARPFIERAAAYASMMIQAVQKAMGDRELVVFGDGGSLTKNPKHAKRINEGTGMGKAPLAVADLNARCVNNTGEKLDIDPPVMGSLYAGLQKVLAKAA